MPWPPTLLIAVGYMLWCAFVVAADFTDSGVVCYDVLLSWPPTSLCQVRVASSCSACHHKDYRERVMNHDAPPQMPKEQPWNYREAPTSPLAEQGGIFPHARPLSRLPTTHIHPSITHTSIPIRFASARQSKPSPAPLQSTHPPIRRAKRRVPQTQHGPPRRNHTTHDDDHDDGPTRALLYNRRVHTPTRPSAGGGCVCAQGLYVAEGGGGAKQERWMDARWMGG